MAIAEYRAKYARRRTQRERDRRVGEDRRVEFDPLRILKLGYDRRSGVDRRQTFEGGQAARASVPELKRKVLR